MKNNFELYAKVNTGKAWTLLKASKLNSCKEVLPSYKDVIEHLTAMKQNGSKFTPLVVQCSKEKFEEIMKEIRGKVSTGGNYLKIDFVISSDIKPLVQISKFEDIKKEEPKENVVIVDSVPEPAKPKRNSRKPKTEN